MNFIEKWIRRIVREEIAAERQRTTEALKTPKRSALAELQIGFEEGRKRPPSLPRKNA